VHEENHRMTVQLEAQPTAAQLLADAHRQAVAHWELASEEADRAGRPDLAELHLARADENWNLADDLPAEPPARHWDESPREAAAADDRYWDAMYDRDED
jgi:hypothetical protein